MPREHILRTMDKIAGHAAVQGASSAMHMLRTEVEAGAERCLLAAPATEVKNNCWPGEPPGCAALSRRGGLILFTCQCQLNLPSCR